MRCTRGNLRVMFYSLTRALSENFYTVEIPKKGRDHDPVLDKRVQNKRAGRENSRFLSMMGFSQGEGGRVDVISEHMAETLEIKWRRCLIYAKVLHLNLLIIFHAALSIFFPVFFSHFFLSYSCLSSHDNQR